jgi:ribose-phosphate pyrophosphokinase
MLRLGRRSTFLAAATCSSIVCRAEDYHAVSTCTEKEALVSLISGTAHQSLSTEVSKLINIPLAPTSISRFADGEVSIQFLSNVRGHDCFIIQSCASPVNDNIMELLLSISCARRSGARRVIAVIPYFGYKHHRRSSQISTKHQSRFLASGAMDFAKMLQEMGVDKVISVDLQRPGSGAEACFFDTQVPLESVMTMDLMVNHFVEKIPLNAKKLVIVSPNAECFRKARKFQRMINDKLASLSFSSSSSSSSSPANGEVDIKFVAFLPSGTGSGPNNTKSLDLVGSGADLKGADVIIVDDMIDTAGTLSDISRFLEDQGAANVYVSASHGLFTKSAVELIENSSIVRKVVVTNTLPPTLQLQSKSTSKKIDVLSIAPLLAKIVLAEHHRFGSGDHHQLNLTLTEDDQNEEYESESTE